MLELRLLGSPQILLAGRPVKGLPLKSQALLFYLAVNGRPQSRLALAGLLWPDKREADALANLRLALYHLRNALPDSLAINRLTVALNPALPCQVDALRFETAIGETNPLAVRQTAIDAYRGEFLAGFYLDEADPFAEWAVVTRERLHLLVTGALQHLVTHCSAQQEIEPGLRYTNQWLALEPWAEQAHRHKLRFLAWAGQRQAALDHYEQCRQVLAAELNVAPDAETVALYEEIRTGNRDKVTGDKVSKSPSHPLTLSPCHDWGEAPTPTVFYGRQAERARLAQWIGENRCRLVAILGLGGVGKTALAVQVAQQMAPHFEVVIWRSLLNAPPLTELLPGWLHSLAPQQLTQAPTTLDAQLALLFDYLRQRRCLLILDNCESMLQTGAHAGRYRPGYEAYGQLFRRVGAGRHQSTLLLTSREQPQGVDLLQSETPLVQVLRLTGLEAASGQAILQSRGLTGAVDETERMISRYSGNPLALQIVAQVVTDLFDGDLTAFLEQEVLIFADIRDVLNQQFSRLEPVEQQLLLWLAIAREPATEAELWQEFSRTVSKRLFLEAIRSLARRSLLENHDGAFGLQNVVIEYLTDVIIEQVYEEIQQVAPVLLKSQPLLKAQSKAYIRKTQARLILQPLGARLQNHLGKPQLAAKLKRLLLVLRAETYQPANYAAGNVLNLLLHLGIDLTGWNFAQLSVREAYLRGQELPNVNFKEADLTNSVFTDTFSFIFALRFSPDGKWVAAGASDGEVRLWQVADGQPSGVCHGHTSDIWCIAFSPDGKTLASASEDQTIRLWDVPSCQCRQVLRGHAGVVWSVAYSPDGRYLASGHRDQTIGIWDALTGELLYKLHGHTDDIFEVAFSPATGSPLLLASGSGDDTIRLWDVATRQLLDTLPGCGIVQDIVFNATGTLLAGCNHNGLVLLWDVNLRQLRHCLAGHRGDVRAVVFSPDGKLLASSGIDQTIRLWDTNSGEARAILHEHHSTVWAIAFNPDGSLLVSGGADHMICFWDPHFGKLLNSFQGYENWLFGIAATPDSQIVASAGANHIVYLWHVASGQALYKLQGHQDEVVGLAISPDGQMLASAGDDCTVHLWEIASGKALATLYGHTQSVRAVAFSPTAHLLASASYDQTVRLWDSRHGKCLYTLHGHTNRVRSVAFSPDGQTLISGSDDHCVYLWDINGRQVRYVLREHTDTVIAVAYHPEGNLVASGSWDQTICLWDEQRGQLRQRLTTHTGRIWTIAFSPDGQYLASAGDAQQIDLWNINTGQVQRVLSGHRARVWSLVFTNDGNCLVSSSTDRTIKVWTVDTGACHHTLQAPGPYTGMNITGVTGISDAQKAALKALGAIDGT